MLQTVTSPSTVAAVFSLVAMGAWCAFSLAWNEHLVLEQSVASVF